MIKTTMNFIVVFLVFELFNVALNVSSCALSNIVGDGAHDVPITVLSDIGKTVDKYILSTNNIPSVTVDKYVIMPNHIHMILIVDNNGTSKAPSPTVNKKMTAFGYIGFCHLRRGLYFCFASFCYLRCGLR